MNKLKYKHRIGGILLLLFSLTYLRLALQLPTGGDDEVFTPGTLPLLLAVTMIICSVIQIALPASENESIDADTAGYNWRLVFMLVTLMFLYVLTFSFFGFALSGILFLFSGFYLLGERRYLTSLLIASGLVLGMWFALTRVFDIYLDPGDLYRMLFGGQT